MSQTHLLCTTHSEFVRRWHVLDRWSISYYRSGALDRFPRCLLRHFPIIFFYLSLVLSKVSSLYFLWWQHFLTPLLLIALPHCWSLSSSNTETAVACQSMRLLGWNWPRLNIDKSACSTGCINVLPYPLAVVLFLHSFLTKWGKWIIVICSWWCGCVCACAHATVT